MSPQTKTVPDDILEAAKKSADALILRMCMTMDHSFGLQSEQKQRGLRTSMEQLVEHDIAPAIANAINDAVMAERERDKSQSIISAPIGQQLLVWEPMYGWLIATRSPFDHVWRLKSSGNHWMDKPAEVEFTHWVSLPATPRAEG